MRIKDYKFHILALAIILVSFGAVAVLFQFGVNNNTQKQALNQADTITTGDLYRVDMLLKKYEEFFEYGYDMHDVTLFNPREGATSHFNDTNMVILLASEMETNGSSEYYLYLTNSTKTKYGRMNISVIFENNDEQGESFLFEADGKIVFSSKTTNYNQFYNILRENNHTLDIDSFKESIINDGHYKNTLNILGDESFVVVYTFGNYFYAEAISVKLLVNSMQFLGINVAFYIGTFILVILAIIDIFLILRKETKLMTFNSKVYKKSGLPVVRIDKRGNVIKGNKTFNRVFGNKIMFNSVNSFKAVDTTDVLENCKKELNFLVSHTQESGKEAFISFNPIANRGEYYLVGRDITKKYIADKFLLDRSSKNSVTGEDNLLCLAAVFDNTKEIAKESKVYLALINIIGFREINKVLGRKIGDMVLIEFARLIKENFNSPIYQVEGDDFITVVTADEQRMNKYCSDFLKNMKEPLFVAENHIFIKVKIGIFHLAMPTYETINIDDCVAKLEVAMLKAKGTINRDYIFYDTALETFVQKNNQMQVDLIKAVKNNEFVMHYQPQFNVATNKIVGFEALIRWINPKYVNISPQDFIEKAEQNGCIIEIGNFVIREVFKAAQTFEKYNVHLSCNVSPAQIVQAGFVQDLLAEYEKNHLKPGAVAIEITETFLMESFDTVIEKLKALKNKGFSIHLDDFGTGYSSMLYLKDLPIDTLKIDKEFIKHVETDKFSRAIVKKIVSLGNDLDLNVICEGVESSAQNTVVKKLGCNIIQGYLIGRAMPMEEAIASIEKYDVKK